MKPLHKLAVIRDNEETPCPFGLSIASACHSVGNVIDKMKPINEDNDDVQNQAIIKRNLAIWKRSQEQESKCKYAAHLFKKKPHYVDCNYGEATAGISQEVSFSGSPYYSQIGEGVGIGGLYNYPVTNYTDGMEYRNLYYGLAGWASKREWRSLLRQSLLATLSSIKR